MSSSDPPALRNWNYLIMRPSTIDPTDDAILAVNSPDDIGTNPNGIMMPPQMRLRSSRQPNGKQSLELEGAKWINLTIGAEIRPGHSKCQTFPLRR